MFRNRRWLRLSCLLAAVVATSGPATAQSFFEKLFGLGGGAPPPPRSHLGHPPGASLPPVNWRAPPPSEDWRGSNHRDRQADPGDDHVDRRSKGDPFTGRVRTVCVRLCDGYFWPISSTTSVRNLQNDARKCEQSCGVDAILFHEPAPGGDADELVDQDGRPYSSLPNAFLYRKSTVKGCACKPEPWDQAELARHRGYAADEAEAEQSRRLAAGDARTQQSVMRTEAGIAAATPATDHPRADTALEPPQAPTAGHDDAEVVAAQPSDPPQLHPQASLAAEEPQRRPASRQLAFDAGAFQQQIEAAARTQAPAARQRKSSRQASLQRGRTPSQAPRQARRRSLTASASPSWIIGKPKYVYPGDAPTRYR
jgi:hypothetical protein